MLTKMLGAVSGVAFLAVLSAGLAGAASSAFAAEKDGGGSSDPNADCRAANAACMNQCVNSGTIDENCGVRCRDRYEICKNVVIESIPKGAAKGAMPNKPPAAVK
jgi:hypothetical protein